MREPNIIDLSNFDWSRLTLEQRLRMTPLIVAQARAARARALRDLLRGLLRLPRLAAVAVVDGWRGGARWRTRRRAMRELGALDDRTLRDIGLGRSEIEAAVKGAGPSR